MFINFRNVPELQALYIKIIKWNIYQVVDLK